LIFSVVMMLSFTAGIVEGSGLIGFGSERRYSMRLFRKIKDWMPEQLGKFQAKNCN
jgi:hypothetical protein